MATLLLVAPTYVGVVPTTWPAGTWCPRSQRGLAGGHRRHGRHVGGLGRVGERRRPSAQRVLRPVGRPAAAADEAAPETVRVLVPSWSMRSFDLLDEPLPTATSTMTAATPIRMPSIVSDERSLFAARPRSAMRRNCRRHRAHPALRRAALVAHDPAVDEAQHPLGVRGDLVLVGDEHDRAPGGVEPVDDGQHVRGARGVQVAGRLVGQQEAGLVTSARATRHPLLLTARQLGREVVHPVGEPHAAERRASPARAAGRPFTPAYDERQLDVGERGGARAPG